MSVKELLPADLPAATSPVEATPADAAGRPMSKCEAFDQVVPRNPNSTAVSVRVVYPVHDRPKPGSPQQAIEVVAIGGLTTIPAKGTSAVSVAKDAEAAVRTYSGGPAVSVKTSFSR